MRTVLVSSIAAVALATGAPLLAQDEDASPPLTAEETEADASDAGTSEEDEMAAAMAMLSGMFLVEPLTADQETRVPLARNIVEKMIPEGTMQEMMGTMFDDMLGPLMALEGQNAAKTSLASSMGVEESDLAVTDEEAVELATLFDPAWEQREAIMQSMMPDIMGEMMGMMEPGMRKAMTELYAINFTTPQLQEIDAFFSTETGTTFARKSFTMASDPRVISASMEALPNMMGMFADVEERKAAAEADLPPARTFNDLGEADQARVTELTGYTAEDYADWDSAAEVAEDAVE